MLRNAAFRSEAIIRMIAFITVCLAAAIFSGGCDGEAKAEPAADAEQQAWKALRAKYLKASRAEHDHRIAEWKTVGSWNFDDGSMPDGFKVFDGSWEVVDGALVAADGKVDGNRTIGLTHCNWPAFRISFDATLSPRPEKAHLRPAYIGDIGVRINADPQTGGFAQGYVAILAHYTNQANVIYRRNIPFVRTEMCSITAGEKHRVVVEVVKPHIRVWVDDKVVLEAWDRHGVGRRDDSDFIEMDPERIIALHTYDSILAVDDLLIEVPAEK